MKFDKKVIESGIVAAFALVIASSAVVSTKVPAQAAWNSPQEEFTEGTGKRKERTREGAAQESLSQEVSMEKLPVNLVAEAAEAVNMEEEKQENTEKPENAQKTGREKAEKKKADSVIVGAPVEKVSEEVSPWAAKLMPNVEEFLNIRLEASDDAEIVGKIYKGAVGNILESGDGWTKISSGSVEGFVKDEFCVTGIDAENLANQQGTTYATAATGGVRIRATASASEDAEIVDVMEEGGKVKVDTQAEPVDGWVAVKCNDRTGYINAEFVTVELELGKAISIEEERAAIAAAEAEKAKKAQQERQKSSGTQQKESVAASYDDVTLLGALIQCEAGSEPYEGQLAVGAVVMNRLRAGYAGSISGVIYQSGQFTPASSGRLASVLSSGVSGSCLQAAQEAINGSDNVGGARSFRGAGSGQAGIVIGNHVFF